MNKLLEIRNASLSLNAAQAAGVQAPKGNIVVSAAAGSGKTFTMTERILQRILAGELSLDKVLILTFTDAASKNMRASLQKKLQACAVQISEQPTSDPILQAEMTSGGKLLEQAEADLAGAQISTLHSFCKQLIAESAHVLPAPLSADLLYVNNAKIAESQVASSLLQEAVSAVLYKVFAAESLSDIYELTEAAPEIEENSSLDALLSPAAGVSKTTFYEHIRNLSPRLPALLRTLSEQVGARKDLQPFSETLAAAYLQMRAYADYHDKLYEAADVAQLLVDKPEQAPEYYYFLQELHEAYQVYQAAAPYLQNELADLQLVPGLTEKQLQKKNYKDSKEYALAIANQNAVKAHLTTLYAACDELAPLFENFEHLQRQRAEAHDKLLHAADRIEASLSDYLDIDGNFARIYGDLQFRGSRLAAAPQLEQKDGSTKPYTFNSARKSEEEKAYYQLFTKAVAPLLAVLAPQAQVASASNLAKNNLLCQNYAPAVDDEVRRTLAQERADKCCLFVYLLLAVDKTYTSFKRRQQLIDFSDLEQHAYALLQNDKAQEYCLSKYSEIYVDEYQDTSSIQEAILQKISNNNLFVVGDLKQSIYGFRNAKLENFENKLKLAKQAESSLAVQADSSAAQRWQLFNFNRNYRSDAAILAFVNHVFGQLFLPPLVDFDYLYDEHTLLWRGIDKLPANSGQQLPAAAFAESKQLPDFASKELAETSDVREETNSEVAVAQSVTDNHVTAENEDKRTDKHTGSTENAQGEVNADLCVQINNYAGIRQETSAYTAVKNYLQEYLPYERKQLLNSNKLKDWEALCTAWQIRQLIASGVPAAEIAVLARRHKELEQVEAALSRLGIATNLKQSENKTKIATLAQVELFSFLQVLDNPLQDEHLVAYLTSAYAAKTLTLAEIAEVKASFRDFVKDRRAEFAENDKQSLHEESRNGISEIAALEKENYLQNLKAVNRLPLHKLLRIYAAAGNKVAVSGSDAGKEAVRSTSLDAIFSNFTAYVQKDLADKLDFNLQVLAQTRNLLLLLPFKEAWQYLMRENTALARLEQGGVLLRAEIAKLAHNRQDATVKDLLILFDAPVKLPLTTPEKELAEAVNLLTFHASKGLEYDHVFLVGLDYRISWDNRPADYVPELGFLVGDGLQDSSLVYPAAAQTAAAIIRRKQAYAEELRLLYVALTRAKKGLYLNLDLSTDDELFWESKSVAGQLSGRKQNCLDLYAHKTYAALLLYAFSKQFFINNDLLWMHSAAYCGTKINCGSVFLADEVHAYIQLQHLTWPFLAQVMADAYLSAEQQAFVSKAVNEIESTNAAEEGVESTAGDVVTSVAPRSGEQLPAFAAALSAEKLMKFTAPTAVEVCELTDEAALSLADFLNATAVFVTQLDKETEHELSAVCPPFTADGTASARSADTVATVAAAADLVAEFAISGTNPGKQLRERLAACVPGNFDWTRQLLQYERFVNEQVALDAANKQSDFVTKYSVSRLKNWYRRQLEGGGEGDSLLANYSMERELPPLSDLLELFDKSGAEESSVASPGNAASSGNTASVASSAGTASTASPAGVATAPKLPASTASTTLSTNNDASAPEQRHILSGAETGTLLHKFMQFIDLATFHKFTAAWHAGTLDSAAAETAIISELHEQLKLLVAKGIWQTDLQFLLDPYWRQLAGFFLHETAYKLCRNAQSAAQKGAGAALLYRELPFTISCSMTELMTLYPQLENLERELTLTEKAQDLIQIQGVIDLWFVDGDDLFVIDYKSDKIPAYVTDLQAFFMERYALQLQIYTMAVAKGLNIPEHDFVKRCHAYIFAIDRGEYVQLPLKAYYPQHKA